MSIKCISFSLFGTNEKYLVGAVKNVALAEIYFPEYLCYFFIDDSVPEKYVTLLQANNKVKVIDKSGSNLPKAMWRFTAIDLPEVDIMISRDTDSRLSKREKTIVDSWLASGNNFHIIKDHPYFHVKANIYAGMWGMKKIKNFSMEDLIASWMNNRKTDINLYGQDQVFLDEMIYPSALKSLSYFDDYNINKLGICQKISEKRKNWRFIGEVFNEDETRAYHWKPLRGYHIRTYGILEKLLTSTLNVFNAEWK